MTSNIYKIEIVPEIQGSENEYLVINISEEEFWKGMAHIETVGSECRRDGSRATPLRSQILDWLKIFFDPKFSTDSVR